MNRVKEINRVFLITVFTYILGSLTLSILEPYLNNYFIGMLFSQVVLVIPMLIYVILTKQNLLQVIRFNKIKPVNVILAIIFAFLINPLMSLLNAISLLFSTNVIEDSVTKVVENNPLILSVFIIAFIPCIFEESVYRGVFFNEYRKVNPLKAILLSGFLFGLMHMNFNQFIYAFAMGAIFALMIEATNSILTTMIIHFVINGSSVVLTYLMPRMEALAQIIYGKKVAAEMFPDTVELSVDTLVPVIITYAVVSVFTTTLAVFLMILMSKIEGRWDVFRSIFRKPEESLVVNTEDVDNEEQSIKQSITGENNQRLVTFPMIAGALICIVIMVWIEIAPRIFR